MSILYHSNIPVFIKIPSDSGGELHLVVPHIASCEYDEKSQSTTIIMVNGVVYTKTTPTDILYLKIIKAIKNFYISDLPQYSQTDE